MASTKTAKKKMPVAQLPMKAAAIDRFGPPQVLKLHKLPVPKPGPEEVLIAVRSAGVGVWDASVADGSRGVEASLKPRRKKTS
jgi:NADPH:quinone reductase